MALCPEHPKRDQNPKFTPLSETTSIPVCFIWESPPGDQLLGFVLFKPSIFDLRRHKVDCKHYTIDIRFTQLIRRAVRRFGGFLAHLLHRSTTICTTFSKARTREKCWRTSKSKNALITMKGCQQLVTTSLGPPYFSCFVLFFLVVVFPHFYQLSVMDLYVSLQKVSLS